MSAHILIVEDDEQIQQFLALHLQNDGYRVSTALTGEKMFDVLTTKAVDLIILDLNLPDADGLDLARRIRQSSSVPIIVASARKHVEDRLKALNLGADDYLTKPFDTRELLLRVRNVLERSQGQADQAGKAAQIVLPRRRRKGLALAALVLGLVLVAGAGIYWYGGGEIPLISRPQPAPRTATSYSWVAASRCAAFPQVAWWINKNHLDVVRYVDRRHGGDWASYLSSWQGRLVKLQDIQDRGSTAVTAKGMTLSGAELVAYVQQMARRLEVTRCLAAEARAATK